MTEQQEPVWRPETVARTDDYALRTALVEATAFPTKRRIVYTVVNCKYGAVEHVALTLPEGLRALTDLQEALTEASATRLS